MARYYRKASSAAPTQTLTFTEVKEFGGSRVPSRMTMRVHIKPGEHTTIIYKAIKFDVDIPARKFTEQALRH